RCSGGIETSSSRPSLEGSSLEDGPGLEKSLEILAPVVFELHPAAALSTGADRHAGGEALLKLRFERGDIGRPRSGLGVLASELAVDESLGPANREALREHVARGRELITTGLQTQESPRMAGGDGST